jgi:hypothetical protein
MAQNGTTLRRSCSRSKKTIDVSIVATAIDPSVPHSLLNDISSLGTELEPWSHVRRRLILLGLRGSTGVN